jgi:hypothetical protein
MLVIPHFLLDITNYPDSHTFRDPKEVLLCKQNHNKLAKWKKMDRLPKKHNYFGLEKKLSGSGLKRGLANFLSDQYREMKMRKAVQ